LQDHIGAVALVNLLIPVHCRFTCCGVFVFSAFSFDPSLFGNSASID